MVKSRRPRMHKEFIVNIPCEGKNQYKTESEATAAADFHMLENMNIELDVYQCTTCEYWHMTTQAPLDWRKEMPKQ